MLIDRRWCFYENVCIENDFEKIDTSQPNYRYINLNNFSKRLSKYEYDKLVINDEKYSKIWDCGYYRYMWKNEQSLNLS